MAESGDYLRGFVHGMHFVLLALEGRLTSGTLTREQAEKVFAEYHAMVADYRASADAAAGKPQPAPRAGALALFGDEAPSA